MAKDVEIVTFREGAVVPSGVIMHLTADQADARRHVLKPEKGWHTEKSADKRLRFTGTAGVFFKAGEVLGLELGGKVPPALAGALTAETVAATAAEAPQLSPTDLDDLKAKAHKAGRAEMLAEVEARNALFEAEGAAIEAVEAAQAELAAAADDGKAPLEARLAEAKEKLTAATAAVEALPELKA